MKPLYHIAEDISRASGGVRTVVKDLQKQFSKSQILTTAAESADVATTVFESAGPWMHSTSLKSRLHEVDQEAIFHLHGVWMHAQYAAAKNAASRNIPFIVSPHGMYEPWLWKNGKLKKKLYFNLLTSSAFAKANYIHAITPDEQQNLQVLFPKTKVVCIPNAVIMESLSVRKLPEKPYFLFLGRLHNKKGIELLLEVFTSLKGLDFDLKIAGSQNEYSQSLKQKFNVIADSRIQFLGAIHGEAKKQWYRNAHAFIAPSFSEVIGMVNIEAAMMGTPVITTHETGLLQDWNTNGGMLINPVFDELKRAILVAAEWSDQEREDRGNLLRNFVCDNYSWETVKPKWVELYNSLE
jgi:glycosyltransferase involved in cell wall biosynthesis